MHILILCTGNSCRSQMAEGFLRNLCPAAEIISAGTRPEREVNPFAIRVMKEKGIDISTHIPKSVAAFTDLQFDFVITVCDSAKESCPVFTGNVRTRLHIGFEDPAAAQGTEEEILQVYRRIRDEIDVEFQKFYTDNISDQNMENKNEGLKKNVREKYGKIAGEPENKSKTSCCSKGGCCGEGSYTIFSEDYSGMQGYEPDADMGLGCGLPVEFAGIEKGQHVLDLGSGAGNDCFVARAYTGSEGSVTGLDFTDEMIERACINRERLGFTNVNFVRGDIEKMPFSDHSFDVVISNCVLNLVPDKQKAFSEIFRVLKQGGRFCISDVVTRGELPEILKQNAEMYAGCVAGAISLEAYLDVIKATAFREIQLHKEKPIELPDALLHSILSDAEADAFRKSAAGIFSVTVSAVK